MKIKITALALKLNCSTQSINNWYKWRELNPNHELAKYLPNFEVDPKTGTRYWDEEDVWLLLNFKTRLPIGKNGILGEVTHKKGKSNE